MQTVKLDNDLRESVIYAYIAGKINLVGSELDLTAVSVNEPIRPYMPTTTVMRLVRAKQIVLLDGVKL